MNPEHLYVHVPFCVRRCVYCDFAVTATSNAPVDAWLEAVAAELSERQARDGWSRLQLTTIYVGGGTPSLLGVGAMPRLAEVLARFASWQPATVEWTAEANPESFTPDVARDWAAAGVNRVSLGAQTFHEPTLRWMGRLHGAAGPARAVAAAHAAGLDNVSIDLIFGVPPHLRRDWAADLQQALELEPQHVSLYGLTAEAGTPLGRRVQAGQEALADEESYTAQYRLARQQLGAAGFVHYEVSNFARPGREGRHNQAYWRHRAYLGIGPGAHSYLPPVRSWNVRDWAEYRRRLAEGRPAEEAREELGAGEIGLEAIWLGLRSSDGIVTARLAPAQQALTAEWQRAGLAEDAGGRLRLTLEGWLLLDRLAVDLESRGS